MLKLGALHPPPISGLCAFDYLSRLPQCGAVVAFRLCPAAFKLLCVLAGTLEESGASIGTIGEAAGLKSPATRAAASKMLTALGLVSIERVRGAGGEVRGSHWRLLNPPTRMRSEARALVAQLIAQRIQRDRRIEDEVPAEEDGADGSAAPGSVME